MEEYSLCKSRLYRQNIKEYNKIAIYGVGDGADILYEILGELNLTPRIVCMMDHDLSDNIGSKYKDIEQTIGLLTQKESGILIATNNSKLSFIYLLIIGNNKYNKIIQE